MAEIKYTQAKRIETKNMVLRHCLVAKCQRFELCWRAPIKQRFLSPTSPSRVQTSVAV